MKGAALDRDLGVCCQVEVHAAPRRQARDTARTARLRGTFRLYKKRRRCLHMEEHGHGKTWEAVDS